MRGARWVTIIAVAATLIGLGTPALPAQVAAAAPARQCSSYPEWTFGSPRRPVAGVRGAGVIEVRGTGGRVTCLLTSAMLGVPARARGWFGAAWTYGRLTGSDGGLHLLVGMPGADGGRGAVALVPDFGKGLEPRAAVWLPTASLGLKPGDQLGATVVVTETANDLGSTLVIAGAPGRDVGRRADAGALVTWVVRWNRTAIRDIRVSRPALHRQGASGVPGAAERGDRFGSVLHHLNDRWYLPRLLGSDVIVGVPDEDVGRRRDAGMVVRLTFDGNGGVTKGVAQWQGRGLPGRASAGDRLGAAIAVGFNGSDYGVDAIGIPGKNANGRKDSGAVLVRDWGRDPFRVVTQNSPKVPGTSERGDRFGAAVATGGGLIESEEDRIIVGAPGEDVRGRRDTGAVTYVDPYGGNHGVVQRVKGLAAGDRFGSSFLLDGPLEDEPSRSQLLLIGAPGEDRRGARNAGRFYWANVTFHHPRAAATPFVNGVARGERFGEPLRLG